LRIEWLPEAARNRQEQLDYIGERNPMAAVHLGDAIEEAVGRLASFPEIAPQGRVGGTRELFVSGTPYILVYRIEPSCVVILRLLHGSQHWPPDADV
jgi:toxin ParE1/3/4